MRRVGAVVRNELAILRHDVFSFMLLVAMPLVLITFFKPMFRIALQFEGHRLANGAEQAVPGMLVMFAFFLVGGAGIAFFREHTWGTWDRIRASAAAPLEIIVGKAVPVMLLSLGQQVVLLGAGAALFGLDVWRPLIPLAVLGLAFALCIVALGLAAVSISRTIQQVYAIQTLGTILLAGIGGALTPAKLAPAWAARIAPATPTYWALRGYHSLLLDHKGIGAVLLPASVLATFAIVGIGVSVRRFRFDEAKLSWA